MKAKKQLVQKESKQQSAIETEYLLSNKELVREIKEGENEDISKMSKFDKNEEWR